MKKVLLPFLVLLLVTVTQVYSQSLMDYVDAVQGETLVIKDYFDMNFEPSSIINAVELDTEAPAGRVYMLKADGYYPLSRGFNVPAARAVVLEGEDSTPVVASTSDAMPPILCGYTSEGSTNTGGINFQNNLTVRNVIALPKVDDGSLGWAYFGASAVGFTLTLENVLMESTRWVFIQSNDYANSSIILRDCYFVNMSGQNCRRNGGVYDNVGTNTDRMIVENCTHVMGSGMMYKFRNFAVNEAFFNHNTFVNCSGQLFPTFGYQSNWVVTNNLFINSNVQGYYPSLDEGETDQDHLPMGIINVNVLPEGFEGAVPAAERKILVDRNGIYWDSRLDQIVPALNAAAVNGRTDWVTQMLTMNSRTQTMFNDNATYPKFTEGEWIMGGDPNFVNPLDLMTDQVDVFIEWSIACMDDETTAIMPDWRTEGNPAEENYIFPDWPVPVDLSYTNDAYVTAAYAGLPLGDLNWFPALKAQWEAQKDAEHAEIQAALNEGRVLTSVEGEFELPVEYQLHQNYPNPFNPTTVISFSLPQASNVTLKVYNALGQEVATLVNEFKAAQTHTVEFNASNLASGVYIYKLEAGNFSVSKKMILMK